MDWFWRRRTARKIRTYSLCVGRVEVDVGVKVEVVEEVAVDVDVEVALEEVAL